MATISDRLADAFDLIEQYQRTQSEHVLRILLSAMLTIRKDVAALEIHVRDLEQQVRLHPRK